MSPQTVLLLFLHTVIMKSATSQDEFGDLFSISVENRNLALFFRLNLSLPADYDGQVNISYSVSSDSPYYESSCVLSRTKRSFRPPDFSYIGDHLYLLYHLTKGSDMPQRASKGLLSIKLSNFILPIVPPFSLGSTESTSFVLYYSKHGDYTPGKIPRYFLLTIECVTECCCFPKTVIKLTDSDFRSNSKSKPYFYYDGLHAQRDYVLTLVTVVPGSRYNGTIKNYTFSTPAQALSDNASDMATAATTAETDTGTHRISTKKVDMLNCEPCLNSHVKSFNTASVDAYSVLQSLARSTEATVLGTSSWMKPVVIVIVSIVFVFVFVFVFVLVYFNRHRLAHLKKISSKTTANRLLTVKDRHKPSSQSDLSCISELQTFEPDIIVFTHPVQDQRDSFLSFASS